MGASPKETPPSAGFDLGQYLTPHKPGRPVLSGSGVPGRFDSHAVDCPFVFRHGGAWRMLHVGFDGKGYRTGLATSTDLIHWRHKGVVLDREGSRGWDRVGAAGTWIIRENELGRSPDLKKVDGRYWMVYHAYPGEGYEVGSGQMGLAWTTDEELLDWHRLPEPVYSSRQGADWEKGGLYKACPLEHQGSFYLFYNAKDRPGGAWVEQTGVAVSSDLREWRRHPANPVLRVTEGGWDSRFCSDPCVLRDGHRWVMFYFGFDGRHAQDGLALSEDLLQWDKHPEPILRPGGPGELDEIHAHKPSVVRHDGVLFHFFCACRGYRDGDSARNLGNEFRCITVATSRPVE